MQPLTQPSPSHIFGLSFENTVSVPKSLDVSTGKIEGVTCPRFGISVCSIKQGKRHGGSIASSILESIVAGFLEILKYLDIA